MNKNDNNIEKRSFEAFVNAIGSEIEQAQVRLISAANAQMLFHYWKMGNYILYHQNRQGWGGKVIKKLAQAIRFNYPEKKGYYKKAEATAAAIDPDGWFHTGDAGYFKNGQLFLTERIKDLFKTSNGKYIAPQALETKLVIDRYIDQIAIIADQRKFVSALIVPVYGYVKEYAKEKGIEYKDMAELLQHPKIVGLFRARIETLQQQFAHYEQIKRFTLLPEPFSMERGELTNTLKLKRAVVAQNYSELIEKMYEE